MNDADTINNVKLSTFLDPRAVIAFFAATLITSSAYAITFDVTADFSTTSNPNGPWSFVEGGLPIGTPLSVSGFEGWGNHGAGMDGGVFKAITYPGGGGVHDLLNGDVIVHSLSYGYGGSTTLVGIRWTSPGDGLIDISGLVWDAVFESGRDAEWSLVVAGTTVAARSGIAGLYRTSTAADMANNLLPTHSLTGLAVTAGDQVDLIFHTLGNGIGHFAGVRETIEFTPSNPPLSVPDFGATFTLLSIGLAGLVSGRNLRVPAA